MDRETGKGVAREERLRIGIFQGDGSEFQYEVLARAFSDSALFEQALPFIYGIVPRLTAAAKNIGLDINPAVQQQVQDIKGKRVQVITWNDASGKEVINAEDSEVYLLMKRVVNDLKSGALRALVSLPLSEENIRNLYPDFKNQALTVAQAFSGNPFRMLLFENGVRLNFLTTDKREDAESYLSPQRVEQRIKSIYETVKADFSITTPRIAVLSANKDLHASELGDFDRKRLKPLVTALFESGIPVFGPYLPEAFFRSGEVRAFDAVLCMYREQTEIYMSYCAAYDMLYYTAGLPVIHIEPVFTGLSKDEAFRNLYFALCTAVDIDASRNLNKHLCQSPLPYNAPVFHKKDRVEESEKDED